MASPASGGIQEILFETTTQLRETRAELLEAGLVVFREGNPGQAEIAQGIGQDLALRGVQMIGSRSFGDAAIGVVEGVILAPFGGVVAEQRQAGVVGVTQRRLIGHRVEMGHWRPGTVEPIVERFERIDQVIPGVRSGVGRQQLRDRAAPARQKAVDRRTYLFRADPREGRQGPCVEQWIGGRLRHGCAWHHGVVTGSKCSFITIGCAQGSVQNSFAIPSADPSRPAALLVS